MKKFFNPMTRYEPDYQSVQQVLWKLLTPEQQIAVADCFRHLKNHAQKAISEALIDYIKEGILPMFTPDEFIYASIFVKLTGYGLGNHQPDDIIHKSNFKHQQLCKTSLE